MCSRARRRIAPAGGTSFALPAGQPSPAGSRHPGGLPGTRGARVAMLTAGHVSQHGPFPVPAGRAAAMRQTCAGAIVRVLSGSARPLSALELLDELGHHYRGWTTALARHTLAELVGRGIVAERRVLRPCSY